MSVLTPRTPRAPRDLRKQHPILNGFYRPQREHPKQPMPPREPKGKA